jgi:hypothetical protein
MHTQKTIAPALNKVQSIPRIRSKVLARWSPCIANHTASLLPARAKRR